MRYGSNRYSGVLCECHVVACEMCVRAERCEKIMTPGEEVTEGWEELSGCDDQLNTISVMK